MKEKIKAFLTSVRDIIKEQWQKSHDKWVIQQREEQRHSLNSCIAEMMYQMADELYEAFHANNYNLAPVTTAQSIRLRGYRMVNGEFVYLFSIDKKSSEKTASVLLQKTQHDMNRDIASAQRRILYHNGYNYLFTVYPFLAYGIYVASVQDFGLAEVIITVQTRVTPQNFRNIYRKSPFDFMAY